MTVSNAYNNQLKIQHKHQQIGIYLYINLQRKKQSK